MNPLEYFWVWATENLSQTVRSMWNVSTFLKKKSQNMQISRKVWSVCANTKVLPSLFSIFLLFFCGVGVFLGRLSPHVWQMAARTFVAFSFTCRNLISFQLLCNKFHRLNRLNNVNLLSHNFYRPDVQCGMSGFSALGFTRLKLRF